MDAQLITWGQHLWQGALLCLVFLVAIRFVVNRYRTTDTADVLPQEPISITQEETNDDKTR